MYQILDGQQWRHIWVVSDIHGCYHPLMDELKQRHFNPYEDLLISVGDLIDRGPESVKSLQLIRENGFARCGGTMSKWRLTRSVITILLSGPSMEVYGFPV